MFLAPLNYARFFKKIFSDEKIAKRFLEDFLAIEIEQIELLPTDHKLTNEASLLKFDYRCKVDGKYLIVDMQQWYKQDVVQRFYLYHAANSVLQLEQLPLKKVQQEKEVKDYSKLSPAITIIWMVHDNLNFIDDYVKYTLMPSNLEAFLVNKKLWSKALFEELLEKRDRLISLLTNETKNLLFLQQNQLIFAFQRNIVNNHKDEAEDKLKPYVQWFEFAAKTLNKDNSQSDFEAYADDEVFAEMMRKLSHASLNKEDYTYLDYYEEFEGVREVLMEQAEKEGYRKSKIELAQNCIEEDIDIGQISRITGLSIDFIEQLKGEKKAD
ncbi:MAG: hypothetical protein AAF806_22645 [Bacteroidota bacterium]